MDDKHSSDPIFYRAQQALLASPIHDLRNLQIERVGACLLIRGSVSSFYHKQLAQELIRAVASEAEVVNSIEVR